MQCNGLLQLQQEKLAILDTEKIYICRISQTQFTNRTSIGFKRYKMYHTIHPDNAARDGIAFIIEESIIIHHQETSFKTEMLQATYVNVQTKTSEIIVLPPRSKGRKQYLDLLISHTNKFIIKGDYIAKYDLWGSRLIINKRNELLEAENNLRCETLSIC